MSKIMEMKNLKNKVHRDGFDLSRRVLMTAKVGELLPIDYIPCIPGDVHQINLDLFTRTSPLQTAAMARLREYVDVYFVPYRLLWRHFNDWVLQGDNSSIASSWKTGIGATEFSPYTTLKQIYNVVTSDAFRAPSEGAVGTELTRSGGASKLLSYLGYKLTNVNQDFADKAVNLWNVLAYQKIYQDHFRFGQWENPAPWTYNVDYLNTQTDMNLYLDENNYSGITSMFDLRYVNYNKDYFHGLLPTPQYGDTAIASPITGTLDGDAFVKMSDGTNSQNTNVFLNPSSSSVPNNTLKYTGSSSTNGIKTIKFGDTEIQLNDSTSAGLSVLSIRYAEMFQKWKEITLSSTDRSVKSLLEKHWNVNVSDYFSDRCEHVGGIAQNININEVVNTNLADSTSQADIHGKGTNAQKGSFKFHAKEYGVLMAVYHCKPIIEWELQDTFDKTYFQVQAPDFPIPEFDNIGMEGVRAFEFLNGAIVGGDTADKVVGYASRYINYKTSYDKVKGDFTNTLRSWVLPYSQPGFDLNYLSFKVKPSIVDNLFGVNVGDNLNTDHLQISCYMGVNSVRNLSRYGLPY